MANGTSNIERVMAVTAHDTLTNWRRSGAEASNKAQAVKRSVNDKLNTMMAQEDVPQLMKGILMGQLPPEERNYVRQIVPEEIPDEAISPIVAMLYSCINKTITSGDAGALERLLRMSGTSAELQLKLNVTPNIPFENIDLSQLSESELYALMRKCDAGEAAIDVACEAIEDA